VRAHRVQAESQLSQVKAQVLASESQVEQALAKVAQDEEQVNAEADRRRTEFDVGRYMPLAERGSVSKQQLDNAFQNNLANIATVTATGASV
jgi:multidrug resistance efflux pump